MFCCLLDAWILSHDFVCRSVIAKCCHSLEPPISLRPHPSAIVLLYIALQLTILAADNESVNSGVDWTGLYWTDL